jgi:hypothetical protein
VEGYAYSVKGPQEVRAHLLVAPRVFKPADSITDVTCYGARNAPFAVHTRPGESIGNPAESSANFVVVASHLVCGTPVALSRGVLDAVCVAASWIENNETLKRIA